jgi:nitrate reductase NapA
MEPLDRRTFLRKLGLLSATTAASAAVPGAVMPLGGVLPRAGAGPVWKKAPCRLCGVGCGLLVGVENGRAVAVKGDPDSPVNQGLACAKGYYSAQILAGRDRITRALVRREGRLVEVPLREALDLVAFRLGETVRQHGKDSVAIYGSAQWTVPDAYLAAKLFKGALGTNNVETSARLAAGSAVAGLRSSFGLDGAIGCSEDLDHADVFVLWDANLAETDPVLFSRILDRKRANPAVRILDLATRTSRTSYAADHSLLHAPHAGLAIANAICHEIVARKWVHREFVRRHVAFKRGATGFGDGRGDRALVEEEAAEVGWGDLVAFLADYDPERVQELSGLPAASIRWLASLYGDPLRKVVTLWGPELNQDVRGTWTNNALYNIHLLVGKIAAPGNGAFGLTGQLGGGGTVASAGAACDALPGGLVRRDADRRRAAAIWGVPAANLSPEPGRPALGMFDRFTRGEIRFLWVMAANPMMSLPDLDRYRGRASRADRFLVVSEAYPTPTTDVADVVLPAALWFEREGVYASAERRVQHVERLSTPPGEATSDAWQLIEVARRLGFGSLFPYEAGRQVEQIWEEYRHFHSDPRDALPSLADLRAHGGLLWPYVAGRETRWRYNTAYDPAASRAYGEYDFYGHEDHRAWIWLRPYEPAAEAPDEAYPFWLTTGTVLEHWGTGSLTQRVPALHRALPRGYVEINREDARELGIRHRQRVRLASRRGAVEAEVRIDYRSQPPRGVVFVPTFDEGLPINRLTLDAACPLSGQPDGAKCAIRITALPEAGGP